VESVNTVKVVGWSRILSTHQMSPSMAADVSAHAMCLGGRNGYVIANFGGPMYTAAPVCGVASVNSCREMSRCRFCVVVGIAPCC
jgi:hypothetical protein